MVRLILYTSLAAINHGACGSDQRAVMPSRVRADAGDA